MMLTKEINVLTLENCLRGLSNGRRRNRHLSRGPGQARSIGYSRTNQSRWYDPSVGRWLSEDPTGLAGGDANLYRYCGNGPTDATDPTGLGEAGKPGTVTFRGRNASKHDCIVLGGTVTEVDGDNVTVAYKDDNGRPAVDTFPYQEQVLDGSADFGERPGNAATVLAWKIAHRAQAGTVSAPAAASCPDGRFCGHNKDASSPEPGYERPVPCYLDFSH